MKHYGAALRRTAELLLEILGRGVAAALGVEETDQLVADLLEAQRARVTDDFSIPVEHVVELGMQVDL